MSNIVPFDQSSQLPAHLQKRKGKASDLTQGVGAGVSRLSVKGKTWAIVKGDSREIVMNPKDPESPASFVGVVIVAASPNLSRTYYAKGFEEGVAASQPDCSSANGTTPDAGVPSRQAQSCAACPHAVYGSGQNGKGFRCSNHRRLVVAKPGEYDEEQVLLLNVPGGSLKNLRSFATTLDQRQVDYDMVLTKLTFDAEEATPKLIFTPVGFLPEDHYAAVQKLAASSTVKDILGSSEATAMGTEAAPASADVIASTAEPEPPAVDEAAEAAAAKKAAAKKKAEAARLAAEAAAAAAAAAEAEAEDEVEVAPPPAKKAPVAATPDASSGLDDLESMLAEFDD